MMLELLSPAGSSEAVRAAVQNGADAIYLGYGDFNARRSAANFDEAALRAAVDYCHLRGVKVYLTLNTLLSDGELPQAARLVDQVSEMGVDALLVQDLGVARMARQVAPDLPLHASTQMTVHNLDGVKLAADLGMTRVVVSRELSRDAIAALCARSPVEIECFVHGALCMCYSGQCFFSSVIGGRSGNRGMCAQPCRLNYGWGGGAEQPLLSLKDLSLADHLRELEEMGVACAKIEGRMKRPEYVAIVTRVYANAIREGRNPTRREQRALERAFSRQGFTDAYWRGVSGPDMFGVREKTPVPKELFAAARADYSRENPLVPVTMSARIRSDAPVSLTVSDREGRRVTVTGRVPEAARKIALTRAQAAEQLAKTGGTPYDCERTEVEVADGLSLPLSALNKLRREALEKLSARRLERPPRRRGEFHPGVRYENRRSAPVLTVSALRREQLSPELLKLRPAMAALPAQEWAARPELVEEVLEAGCEPAVTLPRILWDSELPRLEGQLERLQMLGVETVCAGTLAGVGLARRLGFRCRGDFGLGVYNAQSIKEYKRLGLVSVTLSFEQRMARIRDMSKNLDCEAIGYGRLPLMITENCIVRGRYDRSDRADRTPCGRCEGAGGNTLTDRTGARFPVLRAFGCRNEIYNAKKLFLADKARDYSRAGLWGLRLLFTTENAKECVQVMRRYLQENDYRPTDFTRGLYYREVE